MWILVDVAAPAHVHFFRNPIRLLRNAGHTVCVTSHDDRRTRELLDEYKINHHCLAVPSDGGVWNRIADTARPSLALARVARDFDPDIMTAIGGARVAQVGAWLRVPSVLFSDAEGEYLNQTLAYPLATRLVVPECYRGWSPKHKTVRYRGYPALSYLHPDYFRPDTEIALANGLAETGDTFLVRLAARPSGGRGGWSNRLLKAVVGELDRRGRVLISADRPLPGKLEAFRYQGRPGALHHLLAHCRACIGDSPMVASEGAVLGIPSICAAGPSRGYIDELDGRFGLAQVVARRSKSDVLDALKGILQLPETQLARRHRRLLEETENVAEFARDTLAQMRLRHRQAA